MGYRISWAAFRECTPDAVQQELGLRPTGLREDIPESPILGAELPNAWYLVFWNDFGMTSMLPFEEISKGKQAVLCEVSETTMFSSAIGWHDGKKIWSITHDSNCGIDNLEAEGALPDVYDQICRRFQKEQAQAGGERASVDYIFSIPIEVAKAITGFCHNEDIQDMGDDPFEQLEAIEGGIAAKTAKNTQGCLWALFFVVPLISIIEMLRWRD